MLCNNFIYNGKAQTGAFRTFCGEKFVESIKIEHEDEIKDIGVQGIFIEIGSIPNSDFGGIVKTNKANEIIVDIEGKTSEPGIFAAGDVTSQPEKQIVIAAGDGAKALMGVFKYLSKKK